MPRTAIALVFAVLLTASPLAAAPLPSPGTPDAAAGPGEHPRLVFRKDFVPTLRERAKTPEGQAMIARAEKMLNDRFTTWNPAGWALLYQATGDAAYADKAREAAAELMAGKGQHDKRYHYRHPNGQLRAGPALSALALAYDMAYDGWPEDFRQQVANDILNHPMTAEIANKPRHHPGVNHWGPHSGGLSVALLGIYNDPGIDNDKAKALLEKAVTNAKLEITEGFGPGGYYFEGHYCGRISANTGVLPFLIAYRQAMGEDLRETHDNAHWISTKWVYELTRFDNGQVRSAQRGMYARDPWTRGDQLSADGDFPYGFAVVKDELRPALLWTYQNVLHPDPAKRDYDISEYPHLAAYALAYWPIGVEAVNPDELLPKVYVDPQAGYYLFRSGWTGTGEDLIVTALLGSSEKGRKLSVSGSVYVLGHNERHEFPGGYNRSEGEAVVLDDEAPSGVIVATGDRKGAVKNKPKSWTERFASGPTSLAVDLSGKGGVPGLIAMTGPQAGYVSFDARSKTDWGGKKQGWNSMLSVHDPNAKEPTDPREKLTLPVEKLKAPGGYHTWAVQAEDHVVYLTVVGKDGLEPKVAGNTITVGPRKILVDDTGTLTID